MLDEQGAIVDDYARSRLTVLMDEVVLPCTIFYILNRKRDQNTSLYEMERRMKMVEKLLDIAISLVVGLIIISIMCYFIDLILIAGVVFMAFWIGKLAIEYIQSK